MELTRLTDFSPESIDGTGQDERERKRRKFSVRLLLRSPYRLDSGVHACSNEGIWISDIFRLALERLALFMSSLLPLDLLNSGVLGSSTS